MVVVVVAGLRKRVRGNGRVTLGRSVTRIKLD